MPGVGCSACQLSSPSALVGMWHLSRSGVSCAEFLFLCRISGHFNVPFPLGHFPIFCFPVALSQSPLHVLLLPILLLSALPTLPFSIFSTSFSTHSSPYLSFSSPLFHLYISHSLLPFPLSLLSIFIPLLINLASLPDRLPSCLSLLFPRILQFLPSILLLFPSPLFLTLLPTPLPHCYSNTPLFPISPLPSCICPLPTPFPSSPTSHSPLPYLHSPLLISPPQSPHSHILSPSPFPYFSTPLPIYPFLTSFPHLPTPLSHFPTPLPYIPTLPSPTFPLLPTPPPHLPTPTHPSSTTPLPTHPPHFPSPPVSHLPTPPRPHPPHNRVPAIVDVRVSFLS